MTRFRRWCGPAGRRWWSGSWSSPHRVAASTRWCRGTIRRRAAGCRSDARCRGRFLRRQRAAPAFPRGRRRRRRSSPRASPAGVSRRGGTRRRTNTLGPRTPSREVLSTAPGAQFISSRSRSPDLTRSSDQMPAASRIARSTRNDVLTPSSWLNVDRRSASAGVTFNVVENLSPSAEGDRRRRDLGVASPRSRSAVSSTALRAASARVPWTTRAWSSA